MTTPTNSEGKLLNYTSAFIETIYNTVTSSTNYYTAGGDDIICIKNRSQ